MYLRVCLSTLLMTVPLKLRLMAMWVKPISCGALWHGCTAYLTTHKLSQGFHLVFTPRPGEFTICLLELLLETLPTASCVQLLLLGLGRRSPVRSQVDLFNFLDGLFERNTTGI